MIPVQTTEELLSIAHVSAIVASAGAIPDPVTHDFGADMGVRRIGNFDGKRIDLGVVLDLQLKATINWSEDDNFIIYDISVDAYNRLIIRNKNSHATCVLIVCCLPEDKLQWLDASEKHLLLRKCCYYQTINGTKSENKRSVRLKIPKSQLLTPSVVKDLVEKQFEGTS